MAEIFLPNSVRDKINNRDLSTGRGSYISKAVYFGGSSVDAQSYQIVGSKQLYEDPFSENMLYGEALQIPPFRLEQLAFLAEVEPTHGAALSQKVSDIVASGVRFIHKNPEAGPTEDIDQKVDLQRWWDGLFDDFTPLEILQAVQSDYEALGWGILEVARDLNGIVRKLYHVPAHTVRAHRDSWRYAQIRSGNVVWFKKYGIQDDILLRSGIRASQRTPPENKANELLIFRRPSRRSTWYGIPDYIAAVGHIMMATAARDYNILFFENAREPRHLIIITGLEEIVNDTIEDLALNLRTQVKEPHRNLLLPIVGDAKVTIEKMALPTNDLHFRAMMEETDKKILLAHRVPPDRVGIVPRGRGSTGGEAIDRIYKDGVISRGQELLEDRLDRFIEVEYARARGISPEQIRYAVDLEELDLTDEAADASIVIELCKTNMITINEARIRLKMKPNDIFGNMTFQEWLSHAAAAGAAGAGGAGASPTGVDPTEQPGVDGSPMPITQSMAGGAQNVGTQPHDNQANLQVGGGLPLMPLGKATKSLFQQRQERDQMMELIDRMSDRLEDTIYEAVTSIDSPDWAKKLTNGTH
jgi:PBSX family phage portal protein